MSVKWRVQRRAIRSALRLSWAAIVLVEELSKIAGSTFRYLVKVERDAMKREGMVFTDFDDQGLPVWKKSP